MKHLLFIAIAILMSACTRLVSLKDAEACTHPAYEPEYAHGFRLLCNPEDSALMALEVYRPDTMRISIPRGGFRSLVCMSSTYVGALSTLGADSCIAAVSGSRYLTNRAVADRAVDVGFEGAMDYEKLLSVKPDLALIYGVGGESSLAAKLSELSVPYVYIADFEEQNPLGRAEWLVAIGALVGVDGREKFREICEAYQPAPDSVAAVMINAPYSGSWFIPGADNYMSQLLHDAGARLTVQQPEGVESRPIDLEQALPALRQADFWLNPGQAETAEQVRALVPKADFNGRIWNQTADFFESGASHPHLVLNELQQIFRSQAPDSMRYFRRIK